MGMIRFVLYRVWIFLLIPKESRMPMYFVPVEPARYANACGSIEP